MKMIKLGKRRYQPDDSFFEEGSITCRLLQDKYLPVGAVQDSGNHMEHDVYKMDCQIQGCFQHFLTLSSYEEHYASRHRNVCQSCGKILPTNHLLDIHLNELHNPMFEALSKKKSMYQCLVSGCTLLSDNAKARRKHLIETHMYPSSFRFERLFTVKPKSKPVNTKSTTRDKGTNKNMSMDVSSESPESERPQSRFKYSYRVPTSFTFGQGVQKGFVRRRSKGNHLIRSQATSSQTPAVNIEEVDMNVLREALDT